MSKAANYKFTSPISFTETEFDALSELLQVAQSALLALSTSHAAIYPTSPQVEQMRMHAELAADLRERIDQR